MIEYSISNGLCTLRLNAPPVNTITFELLEQLQSAIRRANEDEDVKAIIITGNDKHFSAGADVGIFKEVSCGADAIETSRVFQQAFDFVESSSKPVAAFVAGRVMGSALELAMACHIRVCAPGTKFSMPEVRLGINPGAGGTQRLPRLVGCEQALRMLLTGETVGAEKAVEIGLVDSVSRGEELIGCIASLVDSIGGRVRTSERTDKTGEASVNEAGFVYGEGIVAKGRPEVIAPAKILEAVRTGLEGSFEAGLSKEQTVFAECMDTPATRNKIYLFFATRETSKSPEFAGARTREIASAAVVGMGSMGTGIAHSLIIAGVPVSVFDESTAAMEKGETRIRKSIDKRVAGGKLSAQRAERMLSLISRAAGWSDISGADIVIEAVFEDVEIKRSVFAEIEKACRAETIIASNTSTLSLDVLAEGMDHRERLVGLHFFNPAHAMPLVEVIRRDEADRCVIATALQFVKRIRKTGVLVRNREGFVVNRIFIPYLKEAFYLLEDGADCRAIDAAAVKFGFPMGPLTLIDMAGIDILAFTDEVMREAFEHHRPESEVVAELVKQGMLGQKAGGGLYKYEKGDYTPYDNPEAQKIIAVVRKAKPQACCEMDEKTIIERLVLRMVNEAFYVMGEGIVRRESDVDVAMVLGTGFPDFRGGVLKYANDLGIETVKTRLEELAEKFGSRFRPCEFLENVKGA